MCISNYYNYQCLEFFFRMEYQLKLYLLQGVLMVIFERLINNAVPTQIHLPVLMIIMTRILVYRYII